MGRFTTKEEVDHAVESAAAVEYVRAKDGKDGVQVHITNTSNLPVEAIEQEYPLRVEEYGLIENSGGAGRHRGGLGLRRVVRPVGHDCTFNGVGERFRHRPWGVFGGAPGHFLLRDAETKLPDKCGEHRLARTEAVVIEPPAPAVTAHRTSATPPSSPRIATA